VDKRYFDVLVGLLSISALTEFLMERRTANAVINIATFHRPMILIVKDYAPILSFPTWQVKYAMQESAIILSVGTCNTLSETLHGRLHTQ